jgi:hypothetical protein
LCAKAEPWHKQILLSRSQVLPGNALFRFYLKDILRQSLKYCVPRQSLGTSKSCYLVPRFYLGTLFSGST